SNRCAKGINVIQYGSDAFAMLVGHAAFDGLIKRRLDDPRDRRSAFAKHGLGIVVCRHEHIVWSDIPMEKAAVRKITQRIKKRPDDTVAHNIFADWLTALQMTRQNGIASRP